MELCGPANASINTYVSSCKHIYVLLKMRPNWYQLINFNDKMNKNTTDHELNRNSRVVCKTLKFLSNLTLDLKQQELERNSKINQTVEIPKSLESGCHKWEIKGNVCIRWTEEKSQWPKNDFSALCSTVCIGFQHVILQLYVYQMNETTSSMNEYEITSIYIIYIISSYKNIIKIY